jgi:hypothetical protein
MKIATIIRHITDKKNHNLKPMKGKANTKTKQVQPKKKKQKQKPKKKRKEKKRQSKIKVDINGVVIAYDDRRIGQEIRNHSILITRAVHGLGMLSLGTD